MQAYHYRNLSSRDRRRVTNYVEIAAKWRAEGKPVGEIAQLLRGVIRAVSNAQAPKHK